MNENDINIDGNSRHNSFTFVPKMSQNMVIKNWQININNE